jgi:hypothetical protein
VSGRIEAFAGQNCSHAESEADRRADGSSAAGSALMLKPLRADAGELRLIHIPFYVRTIFSSLSIRLYFFQNVAFPLNGEQIS